MNCVKTTFPYEYSVYQRLRAKSVIAFPFKPNPVGFLVVRNPKRYIDQPGMLVFLAYVLHRAMAQQKTMESAKMHISPENIQGSWPMTSSTQQVTSIYITEGAHQKRQKVLKKA